MLFSKAPFIALAPMSGVTDFPFRTIVRRYGDPSWVVSEMIASASMIREIRKSIQRNCQPQERTAVQLAGNDPDIMAEAARMSVDLGANWIDINMGCPVKKIAINSYAGSALMKDEALVERIFKSVVKSVNVPVSVKLRKGWNKDSLNAMNIIRIAKECGLSLVTLHGRTRCQLFHGEADWDFIQKVHEECLSEKLLPVVGNGDITCEQKAKEALGRCSGIMVGRACYGKPWLLKQLRHFAIHGEVLPPPSKGEQHAIVLEHLDAIFQHYGMEMGLPLAKKHLGWYSKGHDGASAFRNLLFSATERSTIESLLERLYSEDDAETLLSF